jgi:GNAT superfamily N-acetyltransferase
MSKQFYIRDADALFCDAQFMIDAFDSTLPHLAATGNSEQWGTEPLSKKKGHVQRMHDTVTKSDSFRNTKMGDPLRVFIAEIEDNDGSSGPPANGSLARRTDGNGNSFMSVGFVEVLDEQFVSYLKTSEDLKDHVGPALEKGKFVFLQYLVTDHRVGDKRRGAGAALLQKVKDYAAEKGWKTIWLDCWDGGNGQLVQYYVDRGFRIIGSFQNTHDKDEAPWKGKLLRMDLA